MPPIIICNRLTDKLLPLAGCAGLAIYPFVFLLSTHNTPLIRNHEAIHIRQQAEEWIVLFYIRYLYFWIQGRRAGLNWDEAYRAIPYECEAYANEDNLFYLDNRPKMAWKTFLPR